MTTLLRHCFEWLQHCFNVPMLCCRKNCPYESSRVALRLEQITKSKGLRDFSQWEPKVKDGDHEKAANNRPLSLLAVASKVFERIVLNQFSAYLTKNNRLTSHQSSHKKAHSTETLNILLTDKILEAMDKKQITALVLVDLSKAFDSIDHARLLHKLSILGASPSTVKWF